MSVSKSGRSARNHNFFMTQETGIKETIQMTSSEKDLGIILSNNMKFNQQASHAANKASIALGQLKRTFRFWTPKTFKLLYTTFVRPHLEYSASAWSPYLKKDISIIERVQRRATKIVPSIKGLPYDKRLIALNLTSLETRRLRGDLIQYFKLDRGINMINWHKPNPQIPALSQSLRGNHHKIRRQKTNNCLQREHFFTNRIVLYWNDLPESVIESASVNQFKNRLDNHIRLKGLSSGSLLLSGLPF